VYSIIIIKVESNIAQPKRIFLFKRIGKTIKKESDGKTNQKISLDKFAIFLMFLVSTYIQIIARNDTIGTEANKPARIPFFLAISETRMTSPVVSKTFTI